MSTTRSNQIDQQARKLCTHTVVYTEVADREAVCMALEGMSTKAIARALGITESKAQYRILKAQKPSKRYFRRDYRNGQGTLVGRLRAATRPITRAYVREKIAPLFIPLARPGVSRNP